MQHPARALELPSRVLHRVHSGRVGDYVVWLVFGVGLGTAVLLAG